MRLMLAALTLVVGSHCLYGATTESIEDKSTHQQSGVIEIADKENPMKINAFCLDQKGQIVAVCGNGPGEVRVVDDEGKIIESWEVDVKPEAVNVTSDGSILVGGEGKLFRFNATGEKLLEVESPHSKRLRTGNEKLRESAIDSLTRNNNSLESRITMYESMIERVEKKEKDGEELTASDKQLMKLLPDMLARYKKQFAEQEKQESKEPSEEAIQNQIKSMIKSKMRIASISSADDHVFVTTRGVTGYGYDVWKLDSEFANGEVIIEKLSGCCGQMDVQCCKQGIFVAENSRDRVVHYDTDGKEISHWGKSDRTGINGFSSCCNPMNVCFDSDGGVYTAEASAGRIKRFDAEGNLLSYVGDVDLVPGCKNVSIAVSPVNENIYMLDLTRNHIKVMQPKPAGSVKEKVEEPKKEIDESVSSKGPAKPRKSAANFLYGLFSVGAESE